MINIKNSLFFLIVGAVISYFVTINYLCDDVVIPEKHGETEELIIKDFEEVPVKYITYVDDYLLSENDSLQDIANTLRDSIKSFNVDKKWKEAYENANDSITRLHLYYEAIKIKEYEEKILDNDDLSVTIKGKVRGDLLSYKASYTIKPVVTGDVHEYNLILGADLNLGFMRNLPVFRGDIFVINKKGWKYTISRDNLGTWYGGIGKTIKL